MVSGAVAGDDLPSVARSAAEALGRPVAIVLTGREEPVVWPASCGLAVDGDSDAVPIRIGSEVVGSVAVLGGGSVDADDRAWLEAAAAAAAVAALMRDAHDGDREESRRVLLRALAAGRVADLGQHARRLGLQLDRGAVAICAQRSEGTSAELPDDVSALLADVGGGRVLGLVGDPDGALVLASVLRERGMEVAVSTPRRDLEAVHEALREAELLVELAPEVALAGQDETYRLLIGVLLRDPDEVELLRERTVAALDTYDREHDTELLATLQTFLARHGSTTETADAMGLHRHTVGYRLSRVHEVSGLSPYESDGRERLSLGLKAHQLLEADARRSERENM